MAEVKSKFSNTSNGVLGVVKLNIEDKPVGTSLRPKEEVWLSEKEQILTANAPRNEADNPFTNGDLTLVVRASDVATARPIGDLQEEPEVESEPEAPGDLGTAPDEEQISEEKPPVPTPAPPPPPVDVPPGDAEGPPETGFRESAHAAQQPPPAPEPAKPAPAPKAPPPKPPAE